MNDEYEWQREEYEWQRGMVAERVAEVSSGARRQEDLAEPAWITWRAERSVPEDYEPLLRVAFHAGFWRGVRSVADRP